MVTDGSYLQGMRLLNNRDKERVTFGLPQNMTLAKPTERLTMALNILGYLRQVATGLTPSLTSNRSIA